MPKLTPGDLERIRETMARTMSLRDGDARAKITVHMGTCGIAAGARKIMSAFLGLVEARQLKDIILTTSGCAGLCAHEPMATIELKGEAPVKYIDLTEEKANRIFEEHVLGGQIVTEYALAIGSERVS